MWHRVFGLDATGSENALWFFDPWRSPPKCCSSPPGSSGSGRTDSGRASARCGATRAPAARQPAWRSCRSQMLPPDKNTVIYLVWTSLFCFCFVWTVVNTQEPFSGYFAQASSPSWSSRRRCGWPDAWTCRWDPAGSGRSRLNITPCMSTDFVWIERKVTSR